MKGSRIDKMRLALGYMIFFGILTILTLIFGSASDVGSSKAEHFKQERMAKECARFIKIHKRFIIIEKQQQKMIEEAKK